MDRGLIRWPVLTGILYLVSVLAPAHSSVPATVSVQGRLTTKTGAPVPDTNSQALTFRLYSAATGGTLLWSQSLANVAVSKGTFSVSLNLATGFTGSNTLDSVFAGSPFLEITAGADPPMTPRSPFSAGPYALRAKTVESIPASAISGTAWALGGNTGTNPASQFVGTRDNQALVLKANNRQALRLEDRVNAGNTFHAVNVIAGAASNSVAAGILGATIAGGGQDNNTGTDSPNEVHGNFGVIGGGSGNFIDAFTYGTIGGGSGNIVQGDYTTVAGGSGNNPQGNYLTIGGGTQNFAFGTLSTIGGGSSNSITGNVSTIAGGDTNVITGSAAAIGGGQSNTASGAYAVVGGGSTNAGGGQYATIGGGAQNQVAAFLATIAGGSQNKATGQYAAVGGGSRNVANADTATISGGDQNAVNGTFTTIGGGRLNYGWSVSDFSTVGGGFSNTVYGDFATIPGGYKNYADGLTSFAAGYRAYAAHDGSFVWADAHEADFVSTAANQFCVRAMGGLVLEAFGHVPIYTGVGTTEANRFVMLLNSPRAPSASGLKAGGILCADDYGYFSPGKNDMVVKGRVSVGYNFVPQNYTLSVNGNVYALNGYAGSDARWKTNVQTLPRALHTVLDLRGVSFDWRKDEFPDRNFPAGMQVGLIAQEVEKVLPEVVSTDGQGFKAVSYQSLVPVLVEAVKEQQRQIVEKDARLAALEGELERQRLDTAKAQREFDARLRRLEQAASGAHSSGRN